jgi:glutamate/tyrosine decarboxylase-like PLP-dependent enzyme
MTGAEAADSWATDGHKWLNVPYDSGYAFVAEPEYLFKAFAQQADYIRQDNVGRDANHWNPELSRRARGFATYAVIRDLGREGIAELVARNSRFARAIVEEAARLRYVDVLAEPVINQGVLAFRHPAPSAGAAMHDGFTEQVIARINAGGRAFFQPSTFRGRRCMRISVSGWRTTVEDVTTTVDAIAEALDAEVRAAGGKG